jgi:hypothetical protein
MMGFPIVLKRVHSPVPSLTVFVALQVLDIMTTVLGLRMGAHEGSMFLGRRFAAVVSWNLIVILTTQLSYARGE